MPLLDHFRPPLSTQRHWESFHALWAGSIADALNGDLLPAGYFAEVQVHVGSRVEIDVATFDEDGSSRGVAASSGAASATLEAPARAPVWSAPAPELVMPAIFPDSLEVLVFSSDAGPTLVAAVELVSPGNKDRAPERRAFASKCAAYLQQGMGLIVIDVVTARAGNLHNELVELLGTGAEYRTAPPGDLYAVAYRPARGPRDNTDRIEMWPAALALGRPLPTLPLALGRVAPVPLDLESTYADALRRGRLPSTLP